MPMNIYPPILNSTQPAFVPTSIYTIYFTLQRQTSYNEIGHIQVRIVKQQNNKSIANTNIYPDGTIYKNKENISSTNINNTYAIAILDSDLGQRWEPGTMYKIQMRFGSNPIYTSKENFASWKKTQIDESAFSEWSTVMVVKTIEEPEVYIKNRNAVAQDTTISQRTEITLTPMFFGVYVISVL